MAWLVLLVITAGSAVARALLRGTRACCVETLLDAPSSREQSVGTRADTAGKSARATTASGGSFK
jgi:hypothetical protein